MLLRRACVVRDAQGNPPATRGGGPADDSATTRRDRPWIAVVTAVLQVLALLPYAVSGLVAPTYGVVLLLALGLGLTVLAAVAVRRRGAVALAVPPLTVLAWITVVTVGDVALGWTA